MSKADEFITDKSSYEVITPNKDTHIIFKIANVINFVPTHWHEDLEILFVIEGQYTIQIDNRRIDLHKNQCFIVNSLIPHSTTPYYGCRIAMVQIPVAFVEQYVPDARKLIYHWDITTTNPIELTKQVQFNELIHKMIVVDELKPEGYILQFKSYVYELLFQLYHNFSIKLSVSKQKQREQTNKLAPVLQYVQIHYAEPISIDCIADIAGYQSAYFCRFFKQQMGCTFLEYLNDVRLSHFYADLLRTDIPLHQLLETHGLTNQKLFRRMFQERFQSTPLQVRKEYQKLNPPPRLH